MLCIAIGLSFAAQPHAAQTSDKREEGLTVAEFRRFVQAIPRLPGRIEDIHFFRGPGGINPEGVALLIGVKQGGWQLFILDRDKNGRWKLAWSSGKLEDSFNVSSRQEFLIANPGGGEAVQFSGCAAHVCPDVFSILVYAPSKKAAFKVDVRWGHIGYSPGLEAPENRRYKDWLDKQMQERGKLVH